MLFVAEILRDGQSSQTDAKTRSGRFGHLPVNQSSARLLRISRNDDAGFLKLQPKIVSFARAFADAREYRYAAVLHSDVVDQFLNQHRLANAGATEQSNFSALQKGLNQIDYLNSRLEHLEIRRLIDKQRCRPMNRIIGLADERPELINRLSENVHHAAQRR